MPLLDTLANTPWLLLLFTGVISLMMGSFLNVVIHRMPHMLETEWQRDCAELNGEVTDEPGRFDLMSPPSHCPNCNHRIRPWENIPILSWLLLKGRCSNCAQPISLRYPFIELITGVLSVVVAHHFGFGWPLLFALILTWALIALTMIDFDVQLLPDKITLPLLWLGLMLSLFNIFTDSHAAIIGALAGYLSLWSVYQFFKILTGKEGMGYGDFKLLAMLGAWLGWQALPQIILLSALVGAVVGISLILFRLHDKGKPIPFGPYLAAAGWISMMWGNEINTAYLKWSGLA